MLDFNLLPSKEKKELKIIKIRFYITHLFEVFLALFLIFTFFILVIYFDLHFLLSNQKNVLLIKEKGHSFKEFQNLENTIEEMNAKIYKIKGIQKEFINFSFISLEISNIIKDYSGVYIIDLAILPKTEQISAVQDSQESGSQSISRRYLQIKMSGYAPRREQVLQIKNAIEESSYFEDVGLPIENLIKKTDINFNFTFRTSEGETKDKQTL